MFKEYWCHKCWLNALCQNAGPLVAFDALCPEKPAFLYLQIAVWKICPRGSCVEDMSLGRMWFAQGFIFQALVDAFLGGERGAGIPCSQLRVIRRVASSVGPRNSLQDPTLEVSHAGLAPLAQLASQRL